VSRIALPRSPSAVNRSTTNTFDGRFGAEKFNVGNMRGTREKYECSPACLPREL